VLQEYREAGNLLRMTPERSRYLCRLKRHRRFKLVELRSAFSERTKQTEASAS
jgi:hypothetical protein